MIRIEVMFYEIEFKTVFCHNYNSFLSNNGLKFRSNLFHIPLAPMYISILIIYIGRLIKNLLNLNKLILKFLKKYQ